MIKTISRERLRDMMERNEDFVLVDVLSPDSFEAEHIPGSINIPFDEIESRVKKLINRNDKVITYCANFHCDLSSNAAQKLTELGYKNVWEYEGGLQDWKEGSYPLVKSTRAKAVGE